MEYVRIIVRVRARPSAVAARAIDRINESVRFAP